MREVQGGGLGPERTCVRVHACTPGLSNERNEHRLWSQIGLQPQLRHGMATSLARSLVSRNVLYLEHSPFSLCQRLRGWEDVSQPHINGGPWDSRKVGNPWLDPAPPNGRAGGGWSHQPETHPHREPGSSCLALHPLAPGPAHLRIPAVCQAVPL